ncbi:MAG: hypothetical protein ACJ74Q_08735 [Pyrinomonadaceae bacterium]
MRKFTSPLEGVRVAAPCPADWERMVGDERMRYCGQCSLHVYNLSGMTKSEAEGLVANAEGRLCVRYYRRADGSILTRNCPVGLRAVKQRVSRIAGAALSAVLGFFAGVGLNLGFARPTMRQTMGAMVVPTERLHNVNRDPVVNSDPPVVVGSIPDEVYGEPVQGIAVRKPVPRGRTHTRRAR